MSSLSKSELKERPLHFSAYLDRAPDGDLVEVLRATRDPRDRFALGEFSGRERHTYQRGKWSVNDLLQHTVDTERIFAYRALRIARRDATALPGFDQEPYALNAHADGRDLAGLLAEMSLVRDATIALFASLDHAALLACGTCSGIAISAAALGFAIVGHQLHHLLVLDSRYRRTP